MSDDSTTPWKTDDPEQIPDNISEIPNPLRWHKTSCLSDGTPIGRLGAYWYILDEDGYAMSDGYHKISYNETGGYTGTRSARTEPIALYTTPD